MPADEPTILATSGGTDAGRRTRLSFTALTDFAVELSGVDGRAPRVCLLATAMGPQPVRHRHRRYDITTIRDRNRAAKEHAEDIRWRAEQLVQTDSLVGQRLKDKAAELDGIRFDGEGDGREGSVQLVDYTTPQAPQFPLPSRLTRRGGSLQTA